MAASCLETRPGAPKPQKFPAKFPGSRQFAWRLVRSALRRQPGSQTQVEHGRWVKWASTGASQRFCYFGEMWGIVWIKTVIPRGLLYGGIGR
jgi:hypothetical protein